MSGNLSFIVEFRDNSVELLKADCFVGSSFMVDVGAV